MDEVERDDSYFDDVYERLREMARQWMADERRDHTLQPTALVHEVYLRLARQDPERWQDRSHFCAIAAGMMRRVLIDHARQRHAAKRSRGRARVALDDVEDTAPPDHVDLLALDQALNRLARLSPRQCRIVELRYLGGLSMAETAEAMDVSLRTANGDWRAARAWLSGELGEREGRP